jgi:hypothetical protein
MRGTVGPFWLAAAVLAAGGCSILDEVGGGGLSFDLPISRDFKVDSADSRWWPYPPTGIPEVVCSGPAALVTDCCQLPAPAAVDCQEYPLSCDEDTRCALVFDYDDAREIDLASVPALQDQRSWVLAQATVDPIETHMEVSDAGALPLRTASLFVAPQGTTSAHAAGSAFLTGIPLASEASRVPLNAEARLALLSFLMDFNTPFALILSTHVVVESGPAPTGAVSFHVKARVHASF